MMNMAKAGGGSLRAIQCVAMLVLLLAGCGVPDGINRLQETVDESFENADGLPTPASGVANTQAGDRWAEYADETGLYTIDFPEEPEFIRVEDGGEAVRGWMSRSESNDYQISELDIGFGMTYDFAAGVSGTINGAVKAIEEKVGRSATSEMISESPDSRYGFEGVGFVATVSVEGDPHATVHGAIYNTGDRVLLLRMIDVGNDDKADAERFLRSLDFVP